MIASLGKSIGSGVLSTRTVLENPRDRPISREQKMRMRLGGSPNLLEPAYASTRVGLQRKPRSSASLPWSRPRLVSKLAAGASGSVFWLRWISDDLCYSRLNCSVSSSMTMRCYLLLISIILYAVATTGCAPRQLSANCLQSVWFGTPFKYNSGYPGKYFKSDTWVNTWTDDGNIYTTQTMAAEDAKAPPTLICKSACSVVLPLHLLVLMSMICPVGERSRERF